MRNVSIALTRISLRWATNSTDPNAWESLAATNVLPTPVAMTSNALSIPSSRVRFREFRAVICGPRGTMVPGTIPSVPIRGLLHDLL